MNAGFSLVELLAVVTISAILALAGVAVFRRYMNGSRGSEAVAYLAAMRAGQAMYMSENRSYLNASTNNGGVSWYPRLSPDSVRTTWINRTHPDWARWQLLPMSLTRPVAFSYLCNAGGPNTAITKLTNDFQGGPTLPVPTVDWYMLQAKGDTNGDGKYALYAMSSLTNEVYSENDGD